MRTTRQTPATASEAVTALCGQQGGRVLGWFRRLGLGLHDAEDCAQETLLRVQRSAPRAPGGAFLRRVSRSVYADWCRRQRVRRAAVAVVSFEEFADLAASSRSDPAELLDLDAALTRLPPKLADVVDLGVRRGLPYREVADQLGIPVGTVKSRMYLAVQRLRKELVRGS